MTEQAKDIAERAGEVRQMVVELPAEDQRQGALFSERYWALNAAVKEIGGEQRIASEGYRADVVEVLEGLREETDAAFRAFRQERGIPEL